MGCVNCKQRFQEDMKFTFPCLENPSSQDGQDLPFAAILVLTNNVKMPLRSPAVPAFFSVAVIKH